MITYNDNYKGNEVHFTSDTHWWHKNIIKYSNRPFKDVFEMNKALIDNWNARVKPTDHVFHLGDFGFTKIGEIKNILLSLNGKKHLILGNHDEEIEKYSDDLLNGHFVEEIVNYKEICVDNTIIVMFHYPMQEWNKGHRGSFALHGHCHGNVKPLGKQVDVGVDAKFILNGKTEYRPYGFYEISDFMKTREMIKHHDV